MKAETGLCLAAIGVFFVLLSADVEPSALALAAPKFQAPGQFLTHLFLEHGLVLDKCRPMVLRGGGSGLRSNDASESNKGGSKTGKIADKMRLKLASIGRRKELMKKYDEKWMKTKVERPEKTDSLSHAHKKLRRNTHNQSDTTITETAANETAKSVHRSADAILAHLNRTGLCNSSELDNRVQTFMIAMKKSGEKDALVRGLEQFKEYLLRPTSSKRNIRNKSAVLTKLLLDAKSGKTTALQKNQTGDQASDETASSAQLSWSAAYRWGVALSGQDSRVATALCNSTYMESYATVVTEQVFRADRDHEIRLRVGNMSRMMFIGAISKRKSLNGAQNVSEWWGRYNMTGMVWYTVSNGRVLNGAVRIPYTGGGFASGAIVTLRLLLTQGRVEFDVGGRSHGFVTDVEGRVRVAVQFKNDGDSIELLERRAIVRVADSVSDVDGGVGANASQLAPAPDPPDPRYMSPFGGRKVFVGGTKDLDSEEVKEHFERFGAVATTGIMRRIDGKSRGFGFVSFLDRRDAMRAVQKGVTTRKKGNEFARMQITDCTAPMRGDLELDTRTAEILREADAKRSAEVANKRLVAEEQRKPEVAQRAEARVERTRAVALDCEMVGVGHSGRESVLAKVSIVNEKFQLLYSRLVIPSEEVTDYRSEITGIREGELTAEKGALPFEQVQKEVAAVLKGRVLVGHALHNDFKVLDLYHPWGDVRDTARYKPLREPGQMGQPSLKSLAKRVLGATVQSGVHSAAEDAATCMRIYHMHKLGWERSFAQSQKKMTMRARSNLKRKSK